MCGFVGEIRLDGEMASLQTVEKMAEVIAARGPDGYGVFHQNHIALSHQRLKIMDLSDHAAQPMVDNELGLVLVFNGAIYNYQELRTELQAKGYHFFSTGDTEVILKAYHAWGKDCVKRLNGMFAFVVWERDTDRVVMARDRLGIKPLYYQATQNVVRVASTLPCLLATGDVDTSIDPVALNYYMSFHAVVPAPHTILNGVRKLPPATIAELKPNGTLEMERYWHVNYVHSTADQGRSEEDWADEVQEVLTQAVKRRLVADVSVGVLLSGGLDSSLIVGLLHELGQRDLQTFSVGFETVGDEEGNEFKYSDLVAEHYGTRHHRINATHEMLLGNLSDCVGAMSEPMVSHDVIGFYLLSHEVNKHVKVVQSGQGADEVFGGYHWYPPMLDAPAAKAVDTYADVFFDRDFADYKNMVASGLVGQDHARQFVTDHFAQDGAEAPVDKAMRLDTHVMLVDDPVKRVDNMTMAWGLEARVPFLDHTVVELAARIPAEHKLSHGGKGVLKTVARRLIPHAVIDRPKGYFPVPALKYIEGPYLDMVRDLMTSERAQARGVFNMDAIETFMQSPRDHITRLRGSKLWQMAVLEYWLQEHGL